MDEFGSITIDNKNLLNDLLGLESVKNDDELTLYKPRKNNYIQSKSQLQNQLNQNFQSSYLPTQGRKILLESPTFTKKEDDIYRYVHSRISNVDNTSFSRTQNLTDSLENNDNDNLNVKNFYDNTNGINQINDNNYLQEPQRRIGSNRLLSDLAVASVNNQDFPQSQAKTIRQPNNIEDPIYENELLDSFDTNNRTINNNNLNSIQNTTNQQYQYNNNNNNNNINHNNQSFQFQSQPTKLSQSFLDNQFILQQQAQQLQSQQHQQQQSQQSLQSSTSQFKPILPYQGVQAIPPGGLILLQSPTSNPLPLVNSSIQGAPQFIPVSFQQTQLYSQQPNMFYQEPLQPMFYNTAYPINLPIQNQNYFNQPNQDDYSNDSYNYLQSDIYTQQTSYQQAPVFDNRNYNHNGIQSVSGTRYDAQPLQQPLITHPIPQPRGNNKSNLKTISQQSNDSYDMNTPESDEGDLVNEFHQMKINNHNNYEELNENEETKAQEVWQKLQKQRELKDKSSGKKKIQTPNTAGNLSTVNNSNTSLNKINATFKKPPLPDNKRSDTNFLERNMDAIRNKENLTHRYPEKKYEVVHGKNITERVKHFQSPGKKPPHHLQPIDNFDEEQEEDNHLNFKSLSDNYNNTYSNGNINKRITIPVNQDKLKDQDSINVDINLRLVDFLPNQANANRSVDDFDVHNDPLARYIRHYETNISRSLPGSSGSLNKLKPLPPLNNNKRLQIPKPYSHQEARLQHEYDNEIKNEEGYLAQMQKAHSKPVIKTYSLKDYRTFKKDTLSNTNNNTGKLGFDYESDIYRQKIEVTQKKNEYAERVKLRNRILINEQKKNVEDNDSTRTLQAEPSKNQRAKEYVKNHVLRARSATQIRNQEQNQKEITHDKPKLRSFKDKNKTINSKTISENDASSTKSFKSLPDRPQGVYFKQRDINRPDDTAIVRIRDPVTSKVKTIYLNDTQIEELSKRHQQDKEKVNNVITNKSSSSNISPLKIEKPRQPIDFNDNKTFIEENKIKDSYKVGLKIEEQKSSGERITDKRNDSENEIKILETPKQSLETKPLSQETKKKPLVIEDENFEKLIERHKNEKKLVEDFQGSPYISQDLENQINKKNSLDFNKKRNELADDE